jgi:hypothetical protein
LSVLTSRENPTMTKNSTPARDYIEADALALLRRLVRLFPEIGKDEELNGGDAVERLGGIVPDVRYFLLSVREKRGRAKQ